LAPFPGPLQQSLLRRTKSKGRKTATRGTPSTRAASGRWSHPPWAGPRRSRRPRRRSRRYHDPFRQDRNV